MICKRFAWCDRAAVRHAVRLLLITWCGSSVPPPPLGAQESTWRAATPDYRWSFPRDHWAHPEYKTEWWYFTGHLVDDAAPERQFGYQFTFFRVGVVPDTLTIESDWASRHLVMGHAALTDITTGHHVFSELVYRATPLLGEFGEPGDSLVAWSRAPVGTDGRWLLRWDGEGFTFSARDDARKIAMDLRTRPDKPLIFQGPNGYSRKGDGPTAASLYYSFTRLTTTGTIEFDGRVTRVRGLSWMDKEFGSNQLDPDQAGWDWFSLQFEDERELMVYRLRDPSGATDYGLGTLIGVDGSTRFLGLHDWELELLAEWRSPATSAAYPAAWKLTVPGADIAVVITPEVANQENVSRLIPDLFYWEGAVTVRTEAGRSIGRGYVELTGYGTRSRPAI